MPSDTALHLHDGSLRIREISGLDLASAELVYLSACWTSVGGPAQADESIHLASAFQLAGFRHAVATLWQLYDARAVVAAERFYNGMGPGTGADRAAHELREVALALRAKQENAPQVWACLMHSGP
jgi:CHAT domain-containing protein